MCTHPSENLVEQPQGLLGTERFVGGGNAFWRAATIGQNRCAIAVQQLRERIDVKGGADRGREERPIV